MDGKFISTDIRYRKGMAIAESGDKVDSVGGADTGNESNMDVVSGGGEGDGKDNASLYETLGMIDGGESVVINNEVNLESEKSCPTNKVRFASEDSTGSEGTDIEGGDTKSGGGEVTTSASVTIDEDSNSGGSAIVNIGSEVEGEKDKGCTSNADSASGGGETRESVRENPSDSVDNSGGDSSESASKSKCGENSIGAIPRISRTWLREILQHAEGECVQY